MNNSDCNQSKETGEQVVFVVGSDRFIASKEQLVAASDYFKAMLQGHFQESGQGTVTLSQMDPTAFQLVLQWIEDPAIFGRYV